MLKWLCTFFLVLVVSNLLAQVDTAFWFAAPEIINDNSSPHTDRPIFLRMTAFSNSANVTVSQPANPSFTTVTIFIPANSSVSVDLTSQIDLVESKPANQILNSGLLISSTADISAYYEEASSSNPEMFVLKGKNALGTSFFIPTQNIMSNWAYYALPPILPSSSFDIVATEDNTSIVINPANDIIGHSAGIAFTIMLNKGQVYSATAVGRNPLDHLMGSTILSNKPVAVTIKDDSIGGDGYAGCLDLAGDQIVPLSLLGTKYIALPGFLNNPVSKPSDHLFILATEDNTIITINGSIRATIAKGVTYHDSSFSQVQYIETSKPAYVLHLTGFGCEVGHAVLPQIECTGSNKVAFTRSDATALYMNILVPAGYENKFKFNGGTSVINASQFSVVPFSGGLWKYAQVFLDVSQLAVGAGAIVENSDIEFHLSIIHGDATGGARYGYFSDFNKLNVTATSNAVNGAICANNDLKFFTNFNNALAVQFSWTGPNGFSANIPNPVLSNISTSGTGLYSLTATKFSCAAVNVPINITVNPIPIPSLNTNAPICSGKDLTVNANYVGGSFSWTGPNGFASSNANNLIPGVLPIGNGYYTVTTTANNCSAKDSIFVQINPTPSAGVLAASSTVCFAKSLQISNSNTVPNTAYSWSLPNGSSSNSQNINIAAVQFSDSGRYVLTASTLNCSSTDSIYIKIISTPKPLLFTNAPICSGKDLIINASYAGASFNWSGPNGFNSSNGNNTLANVSEISSGVYKVFTNFNTCVSSDSIVVVIYPTPLPAINVVSNNACLLENVQLNNNNTVPNVLYKWILPNGTISSAQNINIATINFADTGKYILTVSTAHCFASDSTNITVKPIPQIQFNTVAEVCSNVPAFSLNATEITGIAGNGGVFSGFGVNSNGLFTPSTVFNGTTKIRFTYTANNGCVAFKEQAVTVNPTPSVFLEKEQYVKLGSSIMLDAQITGNYNNLVWEDISNTLSDKFIPNPIATPKTSTLYKIFVSTNKNCGVQDSIYIRIASDLFIPNAFSPNGDGINDQWEVEDKAQILYLKANIFDRYGKLVKTLFGNKIAWDGLYNGKPLPMATYYYVLNVINGSSTQNLGGWIQLLK